jgi:hypothetical protein
MADELSINISVASTKAGAEMSAQSLGGTVSVTGLDVVGGTTQNIGTTAEEVTLNSDIGTLGSVTIQNLAIDSTGAATTKYVELSYDTSTSFDTFKFAKVPAGIPIVWIPSFPTGKTTIYAKAETGATNGVQIKKWATEQ